MNTVYLQLGSNIGERDSLLRDAMLFIQKEVRSVTKTSKIYESSPWGVDGQKNYLNQILMIESELSAQHVLAEVLNIEDKIGRKRIEKWGERLIDIDIIFYNHEIIETPKLCIPHKHMHERKFVLIPLNEIARDYIHPKYNMKVSELLQKCNDIETVEEYAK